MTRAVVCILGLLIGCANSVQMPQTARHPSSAFVEVPYPPPAGLAELVPQRPTGADLVWLDGEWLYQGEGYVWRRGGWVPAPPRGRYAAGSTRYLSDGRLQLAPGSWYDEQLRPLPFVEPTRPALTPPNELTSEFNAGR